MKNNKMKNFVICISIFVTGALLMYGAIYTFPQQFSTVVTKTEKDVTVTDQGIADAVDKIYDAVVVVSTYSNDSLISSGTGFVYKLDGDMAYIMTNAHVISGGDVVTVTFTNGDIVETNIVGYNDYDDIAVLTVSEEKIITVAELGDSENLRVGDTSFAVGAPLDDAFSWTVTRGIISGKDRMVEVSVNSENSNDYVMRVLQTDTAINSGNSGGPLCNSNGEVIGVSTLKLKDTGVEGMGFAIPIEDAIESANNIINGVDNLIPYLGISMINVTTALYSPEYSTIIDSSGLTYGVIIESVSKDSPASSAGLLADDIVVKVNDTDVSNVSYLRYELYKYNVDDKINITVIRNGEEKVLEVVLGSLDN